MASRVYDELYTEYGRMPTEEEVHLRLLEQRAGRDGTTGSAEGAMSRMAAAAGSPAPPDKQRKMSKRRTI